MARAYTVCRVPKDFPNQELVSKALGSNPILRSSSGGRLYFKIATKEEGTLYCNVSIQTFRTGEEETKGMVTLRFAQAGGTNATFNALETRDSNSEGGIQLSKRSFNIGGFENTKTLLKAWEDNDGTRTTAKYLSELCKAMKAEPSAMGTLKMIVDMALPSAAELSGFVLDYSKQMNGSPGVEIKTKLALVPFNKDDEMMTHGVEDAGPKSSLPEDDGEGYDGDAGDEDEDSEFDP
jgi:hypothetical protein